MVYSPQSWTDGVGSTPITASRLAHIESGIYDIDSKMVARPVTEFGALGGADDHDTLVAAFTNSYGDPVWLPPGDWQSSQIDLSSYSYVVPILGAGAAGLTGGAGTSSRISVASGATGPAFKYSPSSLFHGLIMKDLEIQQGQSTQPGIQLDNCDRINIDNVLIRGGSHGWDLGNTMNVSGHMRYPKAFNQTTSMFHWGSHAIGLTVIDITGYLTSGAGADCAAGIQHDKGGNDIQIHGGRIYRTPGIAYKLSKGYYANFDALTSVWVWLADVEFDAITTLTSDDANCAGIYLVNVQQFYLVKPWVSTASATDATINPIAHFDGCKDVTWDGVGGKVNGRGIVFGTTTACDNMVFSQVQFDSSTSTGMFIVAAANTAGKNPTNLKVDKPRRVTGVDGATVPLTDNAIALMTALTPDSNLGAGQRDPNTVSTALYDSPSRQYADNSGSFTPTDTVLYCSAIDLPAGLPITNISFFSGGTGFTRGSNSDSHLWFCLVDNNFKIVAVTADDTSTGWTNGVKHSLAITGAPYLTKYSGRFWKGICITKGTGGTPANPTILEKVGISAAMGGAGSGAGADRICMSATGQTTPFAVATSLSGVAGIGNYLYGWLE